MLKYFRGPTLLLSVLLSTTALAGEAAKDTAVGENLPPKIRGLLIQEMIAISEATKAIQDALVRGQDKQVAEHAQAVHDSFILAQEMTDADMKTLISSVPKSFLEKDEAFHGLSHQLAEAARKGDKSTQLTLFSQMIDACMQCHADHALNRFPEFSSAP